ncbi:DNA repair exonuclease SbcCD nuclease subunit [Alkalithermobacter thermoalcaliphilus JW-YL-7 = DSM 7308]|uniref:Calcineurin-like phosphoesterase superfamily domain containing protein n=1 Tax=Alkalithermobacter thermoalcaliphilus JW-YL-7 = DSM 7308 TaxID=1121328 RepID=A0A150FSI6_CLOPD|nr:Calcineurin-like phosphoesterase superfamily domain containing protein [[Clostridium] paradoxum JW-YL-7 = DSM 7308]SHK69723.1 DNA repair exonuclease SbcCD nuclease subunit [[Clostridium] paradoxum JW-YL-7 = DSM 7308]
MEYNELVLSGDNVIRTLFFTDVHVTGRNPRSRKDNFLETVIDKLSQVADIAKQKNCDFVLFGGDLFDSPSISDNVSGKCAKVLRKFERLIGIAGNHDLFGNNIDNIKSTRLGLFEKAGLIDLLYKGEKLIVKKNDLKLQITGTPSHFGIDGEDFEDDYIVKDVDKGVDKAIHMVHGMLMEKSINPHINVVTFSDILETKADLTLSGHYHKGFNPVCINGKYFANPGSLSRVSADISELKRKVGVLYIEVSKSDIYLEFIPLRQQDGYEVLDRSLIEKGKLKEIKMQEFLREIKSTSDIESADIENIVKKIASNENLSKEVVDYALDKLSKAHENILEE